MSKSRVLLVQLPIPPAGPSPIVGNVPLAAGYLILYARKMGLDQHFDFSILPTDIANYASDEGIVQAILEHKPDILGLTCYLWNITRSLWIAARLKSQAPEMKIVLGGPEITSDNAWVLQSGYIDYAVIGEGEQTFSHLLQCLKNGDDSLALQPGLWRASCPQMPLFRKPLADLNEVSSPYLEGILDAGDERLLLLETIRGCVFKCKFCYYPKSYDALYFVSEEKIVANLAHARNRGATEVVLLDPTLNQRKDFDGFLKLLARENHDQQFRYFGELRAEGIKTETAALLRQANFTEVEIGLQSVDPAAQSLMDRRNNLKAFEKGVQAMLDAGLKVKVDLIIGLPGDTRSSIQRGFEYLSQSHLFTTVQVFNLAILPGTAFRQEANALGLVYQDTPPYYVLETPTLNTSDLYELMSEAQDVFESEWDPFPQPKLDFKNSMARQECITFQLDDSDMLNSTHSQLGLPAQRAQALTVWFRGSQFKKHRIGMQSVLAELLANNPHSTVQIVLEPLGDPQAIPSRLAQQLLEVCYSQPNYLDRYYSLNPAGLLGSKRILILIPSQARTSLDRDWLDDIGESATVVYRGQAIDEAELDYFELSM